MNTDITTIMDIVRHESPRLLKQYLMQNPNWTLKEKGFANYTPLMEAVSIERLEMVVTISDYVKEKNSIGIYLNYLNEISTDGKSAILIATCMNSGTEVLEYLISNGANYLIKDYDKKGVQDYAILSPSEKVEEFWSSFNPEKYKKIIEHNIDPNNVRRRAGSNASFHF